MEHRVRSECASVFAVDWLLCRVEPSEMTLRRSAT